MLKKLLIRNYALIAETEVEFDRGFTVITGETGAGKSILLEALALVLGDRANYNGIRRGQDKCLVEAVFEFHSEALNALLEKHDLDVFDELILRRELTSSGRSRAFVNDSPVNNAVLKSIADQLVHLHGQQESTFLITPAYQLQQLDSFAGNSEVLQAYKSAYQEFKSTQARLQTLLDQAAQMRKDKDYVQFQLDELEALKPAKSDFELLEEEYNSLQHAEEITGALGQIETALSDDEVGAQRNIRSAITHAKPVVKFSPSLADLHNRLQSVLIELEDLAGEAGRLMHSVEMNPGRLEFLRERMDEYARLMHKHNVQNIDALLSVYEDYSKKIESLISIDEDLGDLEMTLKSKHKLLLSAAQDLTEKRQNSATSFAEKLTDQVRQLGMEKASVNIDIRPLEEFSAFGRESIEITFDANGNKHMVPLKESASGGEVSRLMLAMKSIIAAGDQTPVLIFDEIDTGVSGEVAKQIGRLMKKIGAEVQIISVTHLPGVAASGLHHLKILKSEDNGEVFSRLVALSDADRVEEIAAMFSGKNLSNAALQSAKTLLEAQQI